MVWSILRGIPKTRLTYEERATGKSSSLGESLWKDLKKSQKDRLEGRVLTRPIASSLYIGAQDVNSEKVPFVGQVEQNVLLHFWTLASLTFIPQSFSIDGKTDYKGYVLAVPEPSDLRFFIEDVIGLISSLETETVGYRPRASVISIPEEGGLEYLYHLARYRITQRELASSLTAVEVYHLEKQGNSIRTLAAERILEKSRILDNYEVLRRTCRNPLYKSARIRNLLAEAPWYARMDALFNQYPMEFFIYSRERTSSRIPFFGLDARRKFKAIEEEIRLKQGGSAVDELKNEDDLLAQRTYRLIRQYVNRKTEDKSGQKWEDFKNNKNDKGQVVIPEKYREARQKVCSDAFLAMRGRREQDFVEYFTGSICSVPQFLPEDDFLAVTRALIDDPDRVKVLAMMALSAHSYLGES
jgi:CRISPR-associated protein Cmx8